LAQLKKQLGSLDVFAVAAGAMISSGLFVLPAIAYARAGPAIILSYLLASLLILPSALSQVELATAMPRAGGTYFYVERSLGPIWGLFGGLANWFSVALKSAFAVVGMALLIGVAVQEVFHVQLNPWHLKTLGVLCCAGFVTINVVSVKHTTRFQVWLVGILLALLAFFVIFGAREAEAGRYRELLEKGWFSVFATAGLVFVSFGGLTKAASITEEVRNPGRNLPLGILLAWGVVALFYVAVIVVTVGLVDGRELSESLMPISLAAGKFLGPAGFVLLGLAAVAAFVTTANGGILAASRYPMAMSRDQLLPPVVGRLSERFATPHVSVLLTGAFMIGAIVFLDLEVLVKTASTLMLILFILVNISVIIMRESRIQSYRPKFKAPLYPYIHGVAIVAYGALIVDMGWVPLLITAGFVGVSAAWFGLYVRTRVRRASAVMHVVERVTDRALKTVTLENELRDILLERDNVIEDRFDRLIRECHVLDIEGRKNARDVFTKVSAILAERLGQDKDALFEKFLHREAEGGTVIQPGFAIPHIVVEGEHEFDVLLARAREGIDFPHAPNPVKIMFVLAGSQDERNYHLRALMAIAQVAQEKHFEQRWLAARDSEAIRNLILLATRKRESRQ
jgi:basic amino acid/polyamine antiporter, APA family